MTPFKTVSEKLSVWRRYREAVRELAQLSDYELHDIRVLRADIEYIARRPSARGSRRAASPRSSRVRRIWLRRQAPRISCGR